MTSTAMPDQFRIQPHAGPSRIVNGRRNGARVWLRTAHQPASRERLIDARGRVWWIVTAETQSPGVERVIVSPYPPEGRS